MFTVLLIYTCILQTSLCNFNCKSHKSSRSGKSNDDTITQGCTDSDYPTLVSCGFESADKDNARIDGGYMTTTSGGENVCEAKNGQRSWINGPGIYAHARCCDFRHLGDVECEGTDFGSGQLANKDDRSAQGVCDTDFSFLTGCSVQSSWSKFDGAYAGTKDPGFVNIFISIWLYILNHIIITEYETSNTDTNDWDGNECTAVHGSDSMSLLAQSFAFCPHEYDI